MHNHNELTRSSLPNWSQRQDFPVSSDKIVEWLLGRRAATWCNISLGHVRFIHSCFLSRYNLDTNVWSLFLLGRRWRYRGSLRLNPGSHLSFFFFFCEALSDPDPVIQKHLPRQLLKCCHSPCRPPGFSRGQNPSKEAIEPTAEIAYYHWNCEDAPFNAVLQNRGKIHEYVVIFNPQNSLS